MEAPQNQRGRARVSGPRSDNIEPTTQRPAQREAADDRSRKKIPKKLKSGGRSTDKRCEESSLRRGVGVDGGLATATLRGWAAAGIVQPATARRESRHESKTRQHTDPSARVGVLGSPPPGLAWGTRRRVVRAVQPFRLLPGRVAPQRRGRQHDRRSLGTGAPAGPPAPSGSATTGRSLAAQGRGVPLCGRLRLGSGLGIPHPGGELAAGARCATGTDWRTGDRKRPATRIVHGVESDARGGASTRRG